jgi:predicted RNase H-like HicB family nuclease
MRKYLVVIEQAEGNLSAYVPDVDGCVATGETVEEVLAVMKEALTGHLELMVEEGYEIPEPTSFEAGFVEVDVPEPVKGKSA